MKLNPKYIRIAHKEAIIGIIIAMVNFIWWFGFAYGLGSKPVADYHYIFGLPSWFFYSCIVGSIVITGIVIIVVKYFFQDIPLDEEKE